MDWVQLKGRGKLVTFTTLAVGTTQMVEEGYDRNRHYCSGVVELEEGPRVSAHILGVDAQNPESIKIGTPVTVAPLKRPDKPTVLTFRAD
jgi:uncharacterized OB-fold protein